VHIDHDGRPVSAGHQHKGKFTEGLLDNALILKVLDIRPGQVILDAGCGNGYMAKRFAAQAGPTGRVYALDPDAYFISVLREEAQSTSVEAMEGDITKQTPLKAASIDLLYIATVLHGFSPEQMQGFVKESKRLLKPGGTLAVVEIEKTETPFGPPLTLRYSPEELKAALPLEPVRALAVGNYFYMQIFVHQDNDGAHRPY